MGELFDQFLLVGSAAGDGLAVDAVDYDIVAFQFFGPVALDDVDDGLVVERVVTLYIVFEFFYRAFKFCGFAVLADNFYDIAASGNAEFGKEVTGSTLSIITMRSIIFR